MSQTRPFSHLCSYSQCRLKSTNPEELHTCSSTEPALLPVPVGKPSLWLSLDIWWTQSFQPCYWLISLSNLLQFVWLHCKLMQQLLWSWKLLNPVCLHRTNQDWEIYLRFPPQITGCGLLLWPGLIPSLCLMKWKQTWSCIFSINLFKMSIDTFKCCSF